jgi:hypothetical protein
LHLIVRPDAEADIAAAHDWYEEQREGLGKEFVEEVSAAIAAVQSDPLRFPATFRTLRRALVHRFPYGVIFVARATPSLLWPRCTSHEILGAFIAGQNQTSNK